MRWIVTCVYIFLCFAVVVRSDNQDDFCLFLESKDRNDVKKVEFKPLNKVILGYVGQVKMVAKTPIKTGDVIYTYSVKEDTITVPLALKDEKLGPIFTALSKSEQRARNETGAELSLFDGQIIKLYLIYLKFNPHPQWGAYIDSLPETLGTPIYWTNEELEELVGTSLYSSTRKWRESINKDVATLSKLTELYPEVFPSTVLNNDTYFWASSIYSGRLWYKSQTPVNPLLPLIEVFNYKVEASAKIEVDNDTEDIKVIATEDIDEGEEIFFNDTPLSNSDLLDFYGFIVPNNAKDSVVLGVGLDDKDPLYGNKKSFFKRRGITSGQTFHIRMNEIPQDLIFALRIYHLSMYDYDLVDNAFSNQAISHQNEMAVVESLIDMCRSQLSRFATTASEDRTILKQDDLSLRVRKAVMLRRAEKKILIKMLGLAKKNRDKVKADWDNRAFDMPGDDGLQIKEIM